MSTCTRTSGNARFSRSGTGLPVVRSKAVMRGSGAAAGLASARCVTRVQTSAVVAATFTTLKPVA